MVSVELSMVLSMGNWKTFSRPMFLHCDLVIQTRNTKKKVTNKQIVFICEDKIKRFPGIVIITVGMLQKQNDINSHINSHKGYTFSFSSQRPVLRDIITPKE